MMNTISCISYRSLPRLRRFQRCFIHASAIRPSEAQPVPSTENIVPGPKVNPRVQALADDIVSLNLIEVAQLSDVLKKRLNLPDAPLMSFAAAAPAAPVEEEEVKTEAIQTAFTVMLTAFDSSKKIDIIKAVKQLMPDFNLVQAKKFVEGLPGTLKQDISKEDAEELKKTIEAVGGTVVIQ